MEALLRSLPFRFHVPISPFMAKCVAGKRRKRIGGLVTTEGKDQQGEVILSRGLDFSWFERNGFFNDNHGKDTADVVGVPDVGVMRVRKGQRLPNDDIVRHNGWWAEGVLVGKKGEEIWQLANDLRDTPRKLGFSVEGKVIERDPIDRSLVVRAMVKHIAITHCPVNTEAELHILSKAMSAGSAVTNPGAVAGSGYALRAESLDPELKIATFASPFQRGLRVKDAIEFLRRSCPDLDKTTAEAIIGFAERLKKTGAL